MSYKSGNPGYVKGRPLITSDSSNVYLVNNVTKFNESFSAIKQYKVIMFYLK